MVTNRPITKEMINPGYTRPLWEIILDAWLGRDCSHHQLHQHLQPSVMIAAGLLAKKAVEKGLKVDAASKQALAPGSRVVTDYLEKAGLQKYLDKLGFQLVAYGCTTCIGNSGPLEERIENAIKESRYDRSERVKRQPQLRSAHPWRRQSELPHVPPPCRRLCPRRRQSTSIWKKNLWEQASEGKPVFLKDIWPTTEEIHEDSAQRRSQPEMFKKRYAHVRGQAHLEKDRGQQRISIRTGIQKAPTSNALLTSKIFRPNCRNAKSSTTCAHSPSSATPSPQTTSPQPEPFEAAHPPANTYYPSGLQKAISTATEAAAATTK